MIRKPVGGGEVIVENICLVEKRNHDKHQNNLETGAFRT